MCLASMARMMTTPGLIASSALPLWTEELLYAPLAHLGLLSSASGFRANPSCDASRWPKALVVPPRSMLLPSAAPGSIEVAAVPIVALGPDGEE